MWKFSKHLVLRRCARYQWFTENKSQNPVCSQAQVISPYRKNEYSEQGQKKKERFNKQSERFWNCSQFQFLLSKSLLFETAGWLGTVTILCFNFHHKYFNSFIKHDNAIPYCKFSRNIHAMVDDSVKDKAFQPKILPENSQNAFNTNESKSSSDLDHNFIEDLQKEASQYASVIHNSTGLSCLETNSKKAFRCFQKAARLGSSQGFYNLGLCYELGKGTRVNLSRAAFCFQKAALKGHGLASFNLAIYFIKGLGGLPVDSQTAKLLLAEAAEKDIPQAQLHIALDYLEENRWSEAYKIFEKLAQKNNLDGKYYLGLCHENGWGVDKNLRIAADIYSQTAGLGHSKSILSLSKFYEEGLGGCDTDLDFAMALCQIVTDQGNVEGREALHRLKIKKEQKSILGLFQMKVPSLSVKSSMHTSSSVPELTSSIRSSAKSHYTSIISSYLDLITSFPAIESKGTKSIFYVEDDLTLSLPSPRISCVQS